MKGGVALLLVGVLAGCASVPPEHFAGARPKFDPVAYFTGHTRSWGVFENRAGDPSRTFTTDCVGRMEDGALRLDQTFTYEDGHTQQRHWRIHRTDAHHYVATANDVVGTGTGEAYGNAFHWEYTVALRPGNPLYDVHLHQWLYLQPDGRTVLNRGAIRSFGVTVSQVAETFRRD